MINLAPAINFADYKIPIEYARPEGEAPTFVRGVPVPYEPEKGEIRGKIQPMNGRDLMYLPEGDRDEAKLVLGTTSTVRLNDVVDHRDGRRYKVIFIIPSTLGQHTRAVLGLLKKS